MPIVSFAMLPAWRWNISRLKRGKTACFLPTIRKRKSPPLWHWPIKDHPVCNHGCSTLLNHIDFAKLTTFQQLELLRAYELALIRLGTPDEAAQAALVKRLDPLFPSQNDLVNRELCNLLSFLQSPTIVAKTMPLMSQPNPPADEQFGELLGRNKQYAAPIEAMIEHHPDRQKIAYAYALRVVKQGWTLEQRKAFFEFLREAGRASGGHSFVGFLRDIDHDAFDTCSDRERLALEALGARKPFRRADAPQTERAGQGMDDGRRACRPVNRACKNAISKTARKCTPRPAAWYAIASAATAERLGPI